MCTQCNDTHRHSSCAHILTVGAVLKSTGIPYLT